MMTDIERRMQLQAIYEEIENSPPEEKVQEYFKAVPYHLRKTREVKDGENRNIHEKQGGGSGVGT